MNGSEFDPSNPQSALPGGADPSPPDDVEFLDGGAGGERATENLSTLAPLPGPPPGTGGGGTETPGVASTHEFSPPGPGLPESLGWTVLVLAAQVGMLMLLMTVVFVSMMSQNGGKLPPQAFDLEKLPANAFALVTGLPALFAYCVLIPLACWRMSPSPLRKLNFSRPSLTQALIVCSCVLPLGHISDALYVVQKDLWDRFLDQFPALDGLQEIGLESTMSQLGGASLPILLLLLAVVPAVGEEWMLRGLIGRGLVARWGVFAGVLFTSMLFAVMHLDPPHVAAVFPLGIMMHVSYMATRSFWIPIGYHFLNNAIVSLFTSLGSASIEEAVTEHSWLPPLAAIPYLTFAIAALWKVRTRYVGADGREPDQGYYSFEHFPESQARRVAPNHVLLGAVFAALLVGQVAYEVWKIGHEPAGVAQPAGDGGETVHVQELDAVETVPAE